MANQNRKPHCPNCNVELVDEGEYSVELPPVSVPARLYTCQNADEVCGFFTIVGEKLMPDVVEEDAAPEVMPEFLDEVKAEDGEFEEVPTGE